MTESQRWFVFALLVAVAVLIWLLAPVFTPFVISALLAYLGDPLVDRFEARKVPRTLAVAIVFLIFSTALVISVLLIVPLLERQIAYLVMRLPEYAHWLQEVALPWLQQRFGLGELRFDLHAVQQTIQDHWRAAGGVAARLMAYVSSSGLVLLGWLMNLLLIPVVTFYLLRDWDKLVAHVHGLVPPRNQATVANLTHEADDVLAAFIRGQLLVMLALGVIYSVGLWLVGLKLSLLIGMLAGVVSFVPYLGFIVGILVASVAILFQTQELLPVLWVALVFGVGQVIEGSVLTPWLVGDRIGLHPVAVIFAVLAGGQLFGFVGVLLALPVAAVLAVLVRHGHRRYVDSELYGRRS